MVGLLAFSFFLLTFSSVSARQGCCSHHGGVCGCGCCDGSSLSAKCAPYYPECSAATVIVTPVPKKIEPVIIATLKPTAMPKPKITPAQIQGVTTTASPKPTIVATLKPKASTSPKPSIVQCSAQADSLCSSACTAGNDTDCCTQKSGYTWYDNWGCYPSKLECSDQADGVCHAYCSAGNDSDCCAERLSTHQWYPNWGCYPKQ